MRASDLRGRNDRTDLARELQPPARFCYVRDMTDPTPTRRRFRSALAWLIFGLLVVEGLLWLSERFGWFWFNEKKGWTVLIGMAVAGVILGLMLLWYLEALIFRLRFQFSIRSLLVLVVAVAIPCSWMAVEMKEAKEQRNAVEAICNLGGQIAYDYDESDPREGPRGPTWLRKLLEDDFFNDVYNATVRSNAQIEQLKGLPQLKRLWLGGYRFPPTECGEITDAGLARVAALTQLKVLVMWGTNVTDDGLANLARLKQLENLSIDSTHVTDAGLVHIAGLAQL